MKRVVVTGLGAVTPLGLDAASTWDAALAGRSGLGWITRFDASAFPVRVAAEVKDFDPTTVAPAKEVRRLDRNVLLALGAAREAFDDAELAGIDPSRVGIVVGSAIGGIGTILEQHETLLERGLDRVSPFFLPNCLVACATGSHAIGEGAEIIKRGDAVAMLCGGTEACLHPLILAGFCAMRGLATAEDDPTLASRPFDATRAGFVMGEGAGVLVLEDMEHAVARGANIYAEVVGYGASNDAHHMAQPDPESRGVIEMMSTALRRSGLKPEDVGYLNAHGTSTPLGDIAETNAIKAVFGDHAYKLAVSSTKSMTAHCFGAAGAIEAMMCVKAVQTGMLPPTINYRTPDPECDLDYVPNVARAAQVEVALSNAMGLGGHNGCVMVARWRG
jgi:3-oxoacyl-[acyl-carrier-protein] synthase II